MCRQEFNASNSGRIMPAPERTEYKRVGRLVHLQYLRALAAISVMLYHASYYLNAIDGKSFFLRIFGSGFGNLGVTLFFAISGYLMATLAQRSPPSTFLVHRLIRIYPIYWIVAAAVLGLHYFLGEPATFAPLAFALAPGGPRPYVLGVEWTLPFELTFYLIVFLAMAAGAARFLSAIGAVWIVLILAGLVFAPSLQHGGFSTLPYIPLQEKSLAFAAGLLVPFAIKRGVNRGLALAIFLTGLFIGNTIPVETHGLLPYWLPHGILDFSCAALVAAAVAPSQRPKRAGHPMFASLGDWSYALYLCHVSIVIWVFRYAPSYIPSIALWPIAIMAALFVAAIAGKFDLALYTRLKRYVERMPFVAIGRSTPSVSAERQ
jgi:exopolysaccharide production protein ExoZ